MASTEVSILGYKISEELYKGSRTLVYRGYRESDSLPVVIKLLKNAYPGFNDLVQFRNQYTIAKNLNYPGIIQTYSLETYHNGYALVMEDFGGISLKDYFDPVETLDVTSPLQEFLQVAISLCDILEILYQQRVIHKDIKPANILINPETKQVKLIDFSIASLLSKETQEIKNPNVLEGTLSYISPEQTGRMNRGIDYRSDFYSLGVTFYELLAGKLPFISDDVMELLHCHIAKQPPQLPHPSPLLVKEREQEICYSLSIGKERGQDIIELPFIGKERVLQNQKNDLQNLTNSTIQTIASNGNIILENLDVASILKASQALSCEIQLERLISNLMQVVMENAGAKKAALLLLKDQFLMLEALADINQDIRFLNIPYQDSEDIPFAIVSYVKRSLNTFLLDDATTQNCFITDPYLIKQQPKSVLCMPILDRGKLIGILYLENRLSIGAFTQNRIEILNLLITQAAISLNNAKLYEQLEYYSHSLEQKVKERTIEVTEKATQLESTLKELQHTQTQLIQAEKMSSLGQLIAGIAHEINNPISFISGNLIPANEYVESLIELINLYQNYIHQSPPEIELKIAEMELDYLIDDLPKLLNSMKIGAERIRDIVVSLRNFSRLDEAGIKSVDIHSGIDSTLLILQHQLTSNNKYPEIEVIKEYDRLPQITCYASELNQVFMNIIGNAIDALREKQENKPRITIRTSKLDFQSILISIADNGIGINKSVVNKIFDPFFTTKPVGSGTGLGLSTSYSIVVKKHGGKLSCNSVISKGTEFIIEIPLIAKV